MFESSLTDKSLIRFLFCLYHPSDRRKNHTIFQHLVKMLQMLHDDIPMFLEYRQRNKEMEVTAHIIGP